MRCKTWILGSNHYIRVSFLEEEGRTVKSHARLEVVITVDNKGKRIITGCETGGPYANEIEILRKILNRIEKLKKVPSMADKEYGAVDHAKGMVQKVFDIGFLL